MRGLAWAIFVVCGALHLHASLACADAPLLAFLRHGGEVQARSPLLRDASAITVERVAAHVASIDVDGQKLFVPLRSLPPELAAGDRLDASLALLSSEAPAVVASHFEPTNATTW